MCKIQVQTKSGLPVAIVSRWSDFLRWARAVLIARGVAPEQVSSHDARQKNWQKSLPSCVAVTDAVTATQLPARCRAILLKVITQSSLQELEQFVDQFLGRTREPLSKTS